MSEQDLAEHVNRLVNRIGRQLAGQGSAIQGAVLADLVSMWLAGHIVEAPTDLAADIEGLRQKLFERWSLTVWELVPANEAIIRERHGLAPTDKEMN